MDVENNELDANSDLQTLQSAYRKTAKRMLDDLYGWVTVSDRVVQALPVLTANSSEDFSCAHTSDLPPQNKPLLSAPSLRLFIDSTQS